MPEKYCPLPKRPAATTSWAASARPSAADVGLLPVPYLGDDGWLTNAPADIQIVIGIGDGRKRARPRRGGRKWHGGPAGLFTLRRR